LRFGSFQIGRKRKEKPRRRHGWEITGSDPPLLGAQRIQLDDRRLSFAGLGRLVESGDEERAEKV
jgi:hypothetical protein